MTVVKLIVARHFVLQKDVCPSIRLRLAMPLHKCNALCFTYFRGDSFCRAFAIIDAVRRYIIPSHVNIMALTATATKETLEVVKCHLSLVNPVLIGLSPKRPNIKLYFKEYKDLQSFCQDLSD